MPHAIRIRYASAGQSNKNDALSSLRKKHREVFRGASKDIQKLNPPDGEEHYHALFRLDDEEDVSAVIDSLSNDVFAGVKWYIVKKHSCGWGKNSEDCGDWKIADERGSVPEEYR